MVMLLARKALSLIPELALCTMAEMDEEWLEGAGEARSGASTKRVAVGASGKEEKERELNHLIVTAQNA